MFPPHLPSPSVSVRLHREWQRFKSLFLLVVIALVAGFCGAAVLLSWVWPLVYAGSFDTVLPKRAGTQRLLLETVVEHEINERIVSIYRHVELVGGVQVLKSADKVGVGVVVSSDGWVALMLPEQTAITSDWRVLTANGSEHPIAKTVADKIAGILYLKMSPRTGVSPFSGSEQFKVAAFANISEPQDDIFVRQDNRWQHTQIVQPEIVTAAASHLDTAPVEAYSLTGAFEVGSVAVTGAGSVAGFIGAHHVLMPSAVVFRVLPQVLGNGVVRYPTLGVEGWFSGETPFTLKGNRLAGFIVTKVVGKGSSFKRGDVLEEINGAGVEPRTLWNNMQGKTARVKFWRLGKELELETPVLSFGG